jgi:hypothetical protein
MCVKMVNLKTVKVELDVLKTVNLKTVIHANMTMSKTWV